MAPQEYNELAQEAKNRRLFSAIEAGEDIGALLADGANVEARDDSGLSPLHMAALMNSPDVVNALIDGGANVEAKDDHGRSPLCYALKLTRPILINARINIIAQKFDDAPPAEQTPSSWFWQRSSLQPEIKVLKILALELLVLAQKYECTEVYNAFKTDGKLGPLLDHHRADNESLLKPTTSRIKTDKIIFANDPEHQGGCGCGPL